ncbi:MAG: hypothetical protein HY454_03630 [Parcubacteria group bacterium]|nr:hypothetical protein [Parcubacteria group bacterium]
MGSSPTSGSKDMKNIKREDLVLITFVIVFVVFVAFLVFREANRSSFVLEREDVIKFFAENIAQVSPEPPVLGGRWAVNRFRFVNPELLESSSESRFVEGIDTDAVYIEYEDGHIARAFLMTVAPAAGAAPEYKIIGFFEPGPLGYKLISGEDPLRGQPQEIYEYNETGRKWIKVN